MRNALRTRCPLPRSFVRSVIILYFFFSYPNMMIVVVTFNWTSSSSPLAVAFHHHHQIDIFIPSFSSFFSFSPLVSRPTFRHSLLPNIKSNLATVVAYSSYTSRFVLFLFFILNERANNNNNNKQQQQRDDQLSLK